MADDLAFTPALEQAARIRGGDVQKNKYIRKCIWLLAPAEKASATPFHWR